MPTPDLHGYLVDFDLALEYTDNIVRNDSAELIQWYESATKEIEYKNPDMTHAHNFQVSLSGNVKERDLGLTAEVTYES